MATTTKSQIRSHVRQLDKEFPNEGLRDTKIQFNATGSNPHREVASMRQLRDRRKGEKDWNQIFQNTRWMLDCNKDMYAQQMAELASERFDLTDPKERAEFADFIKRGQADPQVATQVNGYRSFVVTSDILAIPFALGAFQAVNLSAEELPQIITPKARQYFNVRLLGQDGGARQDAWRTTRKAQEIDMYMLGTDKIEYPIMDILQGDVNAYQTINDQLRYDMEMKIDATALASLNSNIVTSGFKSLLNVHPSIDKSNIPDGNYLNLTDPSYGTAGVWTIAKLKAVLSLIAHWQFGLDPDGPITLKTMIFSPLNARDSWDYVNLVSAVAGVGQNDPKNTILTEQREEVVRSGGLIQNAWGYSWDQQFNAQISQGRMYVLTDQPIGWFFTKSEFDQTIDWSNTPDNQDQNMGQVMQKKVVNFVQPALWAYRYVVVDF